MKTFITALISCSLMLGAVAMAQQDQEQQKGKKKKPEQTSQAQSHPQTSNAGGGQQAGAHHGKSAATHHEQAPMTANHTGNPDANTTQEGGKHKDKGAMHNDTTNQNTQNANVNEGAEKNKNKHNAHTETAMAVSGAAGAKPTKAGNVGKNGKQVNVQQIKGEHTNFHAQAQPQKIKSVTFNQNYRIVNAERWQGPQYEVFRTYQPAWHDSGWYRSNFAQVALIGGGYYYFNSGYWYPAWGYDPAAQYYAYDAPIYVGSAARPPDQVIADVQAELQDMGYYHGEVDGLLGPLTREALTAYQSDHGLYATAVIDQPTLDAMGMS